MEYETEDVAGNRVLVDDSVGVGEPSRKPTIPPKPFSVVAYRPVPDAGIDPTSDALPLMLGRAEATLDMFEYAALRM